MFMSDNKVSNYSLIRTAEEYNQNQNLGRRREDYSIQIALLDDRCLMLHSISQLLGKYGPEFRIRSFHSDDDLLEHHIAGRDNIHNVIIFSMSWNKQNHETTCNRIQQLITKITDIPLMILSDQGDIECIYQAFHMGVSGYITTNHDPAVVREAIRLVQAGGIFIPSDLAVMIRTQRSLALKERDEIKEATVDKTIKNFTPRELEVIQALCEGKPNKVIAYELNMQECTVKVHVRNIMKKLNTTNRTQTALVINQLFYT
jgi:DNA-binding NarL/FixJ family response regulator